MSKTLKKIFDKTKKNSGAIKQEGGDLFWVKITELDDGVVEKKLSVLGSSSRYAYFFDANKIESLVIPVENVLLMRKKIIVESDKKSIKDVSQKIKEPLKE